ncbi:uncharacterized protein LOC116135236 [Pistacia vera]|uniref:uncharacterized protein LOC116135236 n=1 Tax=Pistacia vera TaxID=55513 RepID=UPI00126344B0|nr:uncharacterized protein LOC116135236 [Pistacia vera]
MNAMKKSLSELLSMLKTAEKDMKKSKPTLLVATAPRKGRGKQGKGKAKANPRFKPKTQDFLKPGSVSKDGKVVCLYCGKPGHWRKHYKAFLANKKRNSTSSKGRYMIEKNLSHVTSWVIDIGCGSHICTSV